MGRLSSRERARLPDHAFAYIDAKGRRRLPINDEAHVRNALARFNQVRFEDDDARERARMRLLKAAKKFGIVPIGFITGQIDSERRETNHVLNDLREAQSIQANLLPGPFPQTRYFDVTGVSLPSRGVGGDWYDYLALPDGRMAVVLADVAGKGVGAGLLMTSARSIVRIVAQDGRPPGEVLAEANRVLVADLPARKFVTMIYAVLDPDRRTFTFASAGHLPPVLADGSGSRALRVKPQLPLGVKLGTYGEHTVELGAGSRLFLYSDGVLEARNRSSEEYGEARLLEYASTPTATAEGLLKDVKAYMKRRAVPDDITIVMIKASA